ncbi:MAG: NAD(P)H-dependent oxidoreductase subunit E, partial [Acidobacteria bacterium]|nr:NAD(P)H-dependent oxidoreductase subunit E [Acidobacteriota bacterium]
MERKGARREEVLERLEEAGGLHVGAADEVHRETGVPAADVYGVATFYSLLARPEVEARVCQGLSCRLAGCERLYDDLVGLGLETAYASCLGRCDHAPAQWRKHGQPATPPPALGNAGGDLVLDLAGPERRHYGSLARALDIGPDEVCRQLELSGLQGRGGAGFPAFIKWNAVRGQAVTERYVVLNADEGEPGTFKDREVMLRRPHLVLEGLAIAASVLGAGDVYLYIRGEFPECRESLAAALAEATGRGDLGPDLRWHFVDGHGAYICGEETALLEALEGKRG